MVVPDQTLAQVQLGILCGPMSGLRRVQEYWRINQKQNRASRTYSRDKKLLITNMLAKGDFELIVKQVRGEYNMNEESLRPLYGRTQKLADKFDQFAIGYVPRDQNQDSDRL